jgi:hypothetical protein
MKISTARFKKLIQDELFYREFYKMNESDSSEASDIADLKASGLDETEELDEKEEPDPLAANAETKHSSYYSGPVGDVSVTSPGASVKENIEKLIRKVLKEDIRTGTDMLNWNQLEVGDIVDVDGDYNFYSGVRITQKVEDVSQHSGLEPGPGFIGYESELGDPERGGLGSEIVFSIKDVIPSSYGDYIFAESLKKIKLMTESYMKERYGEIEEIIYGVLEDSPGIAGEDLADEVRRIAEEEWYDSFAGELPPERDEVFSVLDSLIDDGEVYFNEEEDQWFLDIGGNQWDHIAGFKR